MSYGELTLPPVWTGSSRVNTDHRYKGIRFYFETDNVWTEKIK